MECKEKSNCIKDRVYIDDGISGTRFDRPGFTAMMEEVEAGNVEAIIIKDMSRLGVIISKSARSWKSCGREVSG